MKIFRASLPVHRALTEFAATFLTRLLHSLVTIAALAASGLAWGQNNSLTFAISPPLAAPGVARQISFSLLWPSFCQRNGATVIAYNSLKSTVTIRLEGHIDGSILYFCDTLSPYDTSVSFTPPAEGDLRVLLVTNDGQYLGETTLSTRAPFSNRPDVDLTGMWYDPATFGSGLTFVHAFARSDTVFGTWYVYDASGVPRWYTIQNVQWGPSLQWSAGGTGGTVAEGVIYETSAASVVCLPPFTGCPVTFATVASPARARIVMQGPNNAQVSAISASGMVLFSSNIIRSIF